MQTHEQIVAEEYIHQHGVNENITATRYIRGRNHGTFGYIRVHSGTFGYIRVLFTLSGLIGDVRNDGKS